MVFESLFRNRKKEKHLREDFLKKIVDNLVIIPGGSYLMGANDGEDDERPIHNVLLDDFYLGKYVVTQGEWYELMETRPWLGKEYVLESDNAPAVNISWYDAREFLRNLGRLAGETFRLPTEAEWEYACRAGGTGKFFHGSLKLNLAKYAWFYDNAFKPATMFAQEVGQLKPNKFGLYDMLGNVYEWCSDWYRRNYYNKSPVQNPPGPMYGDSKSVRGGDWARTDYFLRVSSRRYYSPHYKDANVGFRVAKRIVKHPGNRQER